MIHSAAVFHLLAVNLRDLRPHLYNALPESYSLTFAEDAVSALVQMSQHTFDLILVNPQPSEFDALHIIRHINSDSRELPVVCVSLVADSTYTTRMLELGADDYLTMAMLPAEWGVRVRRLLEAKSRLEIRDRAINDFNKVREVREHLFRMASHDLKNPMNQIRLAQFLLREALPADNQDLLDTIDDAVAAMENVIGGFLEASVVHTGVPTITEGKVEAQDVILECVNRHLLTAQQRDITLVVEEASGIVNADAQALVYIIGGLINHLIRNSQADTTIGLRAEPDGAVLRLTVHCRAAGHRVAIYRQVLSDNAMAFAQVDRDSRDYLALWVVRQMVEMQRGRIGVADDVDECMFWIDLPCWQDTDGEGRSQLEAS